MFVGFVLLRKKSSGIVNPGNNLYCTQETRRAALEIEVELRDSKIVTRRDTWKLISLEPICFF